jgi:subtilisin family serine protease
MGKLFGNMYRKRITSLFMAAGILFFAAQGSYMQASGEGNEIAAQASRNSDAQQGAKIPNQYIIVLKDSAEEADLDSATKDAKSMGAEVLHDYKYALKGFTLRVPNEHVLEKIQENNPNIAFVEQDQIVDSFGKRVSSSATVQVLPKGINRVDGDLSSTKSGDGLGTKVNIDIAILDTGIDLTHPDLNVYRNIGFVKGVQGGNDDNGHGSHVAGIAAAIDNSAGGVGMAPGARLWAVKVLDRMGSGSMSNVVKGVDYVTQHASEIEVANLSLGCSCNSGSLNSAIHNSVAAGVTYVVAAGNSHTDASTFSPANHPDVITVSAIADSDGKCGGVGSSTSYGADDSFATFSNYGSVVDITAPGVGIYSTYKGGLYAYMSGTSMASPHVAGAAALYKSTHSTASPAEVKANLVSGGSKSTTTCDGNGSGYFDFKADLDKIREPMLYAKGY